MKKLNEEQVTNAVEGMLNQPFSVKIKLQGTQDILFHRWNNEVVEAKAAAKKGSKEKKTEDPE
ncbi:MAG: hypothetical protein IJQ99_00740, partial [Synergistaceae bacterium]|nr:hypothetical protein [Synergistaceae bacterium]